MAESKKENQFETILIWFLRFGSMRFENSPVCWGGHGVFLCEERKWMGRRERDDFMFWWSSLPAV